MSAMSCCARSNLVAPCFTCGPLSRLTYSRSKTARHGTTASSSVRTRSMQPALEDSGTQRRLVGVVGENVPRAKRQIVERRQRNEVANARRALLGTLAQPDGAELRQGTDRLADALLDQLDAGNECAADRPQADQQHPELALCILDGSFRSTHGSRSIKEGRQRRKGLPDSALTGAAHGAVDRRTDLAYEIHKPRRLPCRPRSKRHRRSSPPSSRH